MTTMRLKSALWVAAYLRRCQVEGSAAVVRRRGAEEAGAVFGELGMTEQEMANSEFPTYETGELYVR